MTCRMYGATCGGVTMFGYCPSDEVGGIMTIGWGQNANSGELGLGEGVPKSATKPQEITALKGIDIFQVAAGQHTTFFLAQPNQALSEIDRFPEVSSVDHCYICLKVDDEANLLECEKCETTHHTTSLSPPLSSVPAGE